MINLKSIRSVVFDVAKHAHSFESQDSYAEFIWNLLIRNYSVYLFSSDPKSSLANENFRHPRLFYILKGPPLDNELLEQHPTLITESTLWVTSNPEVLNWVMEQRLPAISIGPMGKHPEGVLKLNRLSELSVLLEPTAILLDEISQVVLAQLKERGPRPLLIGVGGPPGSNFQQFVINLRTVLNSAGVALVELLDISSLLRGSDGVLVDPETPGPWVNEALGEWITEAVLTPLAQGKRVFLERGPDTIPEEFSAHFPLFISEESVVLIFAEMLFVPQMTPFLDMTILLELTHDETARRLFEIPEDERFDPKFTALYMKRNGLVYDAYLKASGMVGLASIRVDGNNPRALFLSGGLPKSEPPS